MFVSRKILDEEIKRGQVWVMKVEKRLVELEEKNKELSKLIYKISGDLTPRIWVLEHPEDNKDNPSVKLRVSNDDFPHRIMNEDD